MKWFSLRTKLIAVYICLAIVPIITVSVISYAAYVRDTNAIEKSLMEYSITQVSDNIAGRMRSYKQLMAQIAMDESVRECVRQLAGQEFPSGNFAVLRNKTTDLFHSYAWHDTSVIGITLITKELEAVSFDRVSDFTVYHNRRWDDIGFRRAVLEKSTMDNSGLELRIFSPHGLEGAPDSANQIVCLSFPAGDWIQNQLYGVFVVEVDARAINSIINVDGGDSLMESRISPYSCVADREGTVLIAGRSEIVGERIDELETVLTAGSGVSKGIPDTDLSVHLLFQRNALQSYSYNFGLLVAVLTVVVTCLFLAIVYTSVRRLTERANAIAGAMEEFEHNHQNIKLDVDPDDEILTVISGRFQQMTENISSLLEELERRNERVAFEADQRRRAEIKALQAQINPHFLYNALDRINWMAIDQEQMEISNMLGGLGRLLRYSISNVDILVPLKAEMEWMKQYVMIQSKRFSTEIGLRCTAGGEAEDFPIYKMLLQPLVENSILHGMEEHATDFEIRLDAFVQADGRLRITLADNGRGMRGEQLQRLRGIIASRSGLDADSIGVSNVASRLWLYYGEEAQIAVDSTPGRGTVFEICIPEKT